MVLCGLQGTTLSHETSSSTSQRTPTILFMSVVLSRKKVFWKLFKIFEGHQVSGSTFDFSRALIDRNADLCCTGKERILPRTIVVGGWEISTASSTNVSLMSCRSFHGRIVLRVFPLSHFPLSVLHQTQKRSGDSGLRFESVGGCSWEWMVFDSEE